jgi:hypothetical protein
MPRSFRSTIVSAIVLAICATTLFFFGRSGVETASARTLEATGELRWFKGNMHTHSLWSDGDDYPEMIADWYKTHDYDFLVFTDHNTLLDHERWIDVEKSKGKRKAFDKLKERFPEGWVNERMNNGRLEVRLKQYPEIVEKLAEPGKYLLIQGEEISDRFGKKPIHMNLTNAQKMIPPLGGESVYDAMQNNVNAVIAQREATGQPIFVHLNHPNFGWGINAEDLMRVRGENFFEVYNGHPGVHNSGDAERASTDRMWDVMLTRRITELHLPLMYGLGTDDGHEYHNIPTVGRSNPGRGWVEVLANELSPKALIEALEAGRFYSSSGVELKKVISSERGLEVEVAAEPDVEYTVAFIGTKKGFDPKSEPVVGKDGKEIDTTRKYSEDIGKEFAKSTGTKATYQFSPDDLYVRAVVTSTKKHPNPSEAGEFERAWVQPVLGPAAPKE